MASKRIYYPIHSIGFANLGSPNITGSYRGAKGVQSLGISTTYNLEQIYELGQLELYDQPENLPNVEVTLNKVLDGASLLQHLSTPGATISTLAGRFNDNQCQAKVAYYDITQSSASGTPLAEVFMSGLYINSISFAVPVDGNCTESITLVGNDKVWNYNPSGEIFTPQTKFAGSETAPAISGVARRENVRMALCLWPRDIRGIDANNINQPSGGSFAAHIQNVNISCNLGRTDLYELGAKRPYFRYANFPTEVTTSIEITATEVGDNVNAYSNQDNVSNQPIKLVIDGGYIIDLGTKNKLSSVSIGGGDTGGGNVTITYNYSNSNYLTVIASGTDPAGLTS